MRSFKLQRLPQGFLISLLMYLAGNALLAALPAGHSIDVRNLTYMRLIADARFILYRLPLFLSLVVSIWAALPSAESRTTSIAR
jgi:hypothetical protein